MYKREERKLLGLINGSAAELLESHNAIIAGGAITSVFCNREVNDLDVYFRSEQDFMGFLSSLYEGCAFELIVTYATNKSVLVIDSKTGQKIQLIYYKFFENADAIFADFDFTVCMGAYDMTAKTFHFHADFFKHNAQRYLHFNPGTAYPLISSLRVAKYVDRGYTISKTQMLRIMMKINSIDLVSWADVKDHIGGMYGMDMSTVFNEGEEFSIDTVISRLDEISLEYDDTPPADVENISGMPFEILAEQVFSHLKYTENRAPSSKRVFKNVGGDVNGSEFYSFWKKDFKYKKDGIVNGGTNGIYVYHGHEVLAGQYHNESDRVIIELEPADIYTQIKTAFGVKAQAMGNWKVVAAYDTLSFIKSFYNDVRYPKLEVKLGNMVDL